MAFPDPNSEVGRGLDALAADFSRQPFAGAFYATPSPNRHLTVRPYAVTPLAPPLGMTTWAVTECDLFLRLSL